jgi:hypothetical protein
MKLLYVFFALTLSCTLSSQTVISRFTWDDAALGPLKADIGPDAISAEGNTQVGAGAVGGTSGLVAPTDGEDTNLLLADDDIYDLESIDLSFDFQRNENQGSILVRGDFLFGTASFLEVTYRVRNPDNTTETISSGEVKEVPRNNADPGDFHNYRFVYKPSTGVGELYLDGVLEWSYSATPGAVLDWDPGSSFLFGPLIDGSKYGEPVFDNLVFIEAESPPEPGSEFNPFNSLQQATAVASPGVYYFNLEGVTFSTYVDDQGFVRVALEYGADDPASALPQLTSFNNDTRGILAPSALATLSEMTEVRISSSDPTKLDAITNDPGVFGKILTNDAIKADYRDDDINTSWLGAGSEYLNAPGGAGRLNGDRPLHEEVFHNYYNADGMHWIPYRGDQGLSYSNNVTSSETYTLWVRAGAAAASAILPLQLTSFTAAQLEGKVRIEWEVASANRGLYIDIERSGDGLNWRRIDRRSLEWQAGSLRHRHLDTDPLPQVSYYRIRQTDYDGTVDYSPIISVAFTPSYPSVKVYPSPTSGLVTVESAVAEKMTVLNAMGRPVAVSAPPDDTGSGDSRTIDLSGQPAGIYYVLIGATPHRVVKR